MKSLTILVAALVGSSSAAALAPGIPVNATEFSSAVPPVRFRGDTSAVVHTLSTQDQVDAKCGKAPEGWRKIGCKRGLHIFVPNPCPFADREDYARILCHELGHRNYWPSLHGE